MNKRVFLKLAATFLSGSTGARLFGRATDERTSTSVPGPGGLGGLLPWGSHRSASQGGSPHHHARLASGCWSSFAWRDSNPRDFSEKFQRSTLFLLSRALPDARTLRFTDAGWAILISIGVPFLPFRGDRVPVGKAWGFLQVARRATVNSNVRIVPPGSTRMT